MIGGAANIGTRADQARAATVAIWAARPYTGRVLSLRTASIAALALLAALIGAPTAAAKPKAGSKIVPSQTFIFIAMPASNGWHLQLTAVPGKRGNRPIGVYARGPHGQRVSYLGVKGRVTEDGTIEAKVPGVIHLALRFEQKSEKAIDFGFDNCKVERKERERNGVFRGTIAFYGEGGYTTVKRRSAYGHIEIHPPAICPKQPSRPPKQKVDDLGIELVSAGHKEKGGDSLTFDAFSPDFPGTGPLTDFYATYTHRRGKLTVSASTEKLGEEKGQFSLTAPEGTPTEATVTPPAPFSGSATFKLESPTTASWTGDLRVEIPTLGKVSLAEPGWWAGACAAHCTNTFPEPVLFGFVEFQTIRSGAASGALGLP